MPKHTKRPTRQERPWYLWEDRESKDDDVYVQYDHLAKSELTDEIRLSEVNTTD